MPEPEPDPVVLEWHEQIARQFAGLRRRPMRISDLVGAVVVSAIVFGLLLPRTPGGSVGPSIVDVTLWVGALGCLGLGAILAVVASIGLGRVSTMLHAWGLRQEGPAGWVAMVAAVLADLIAFGLLVAILAGVPPLLMMSVSILSGSAS